MYHLCIEFTKKYTKFRKKSSLFKLPLYKGYLKINRGNWTFGLGSWLPSTSMILSTSSLTSWGKRYTKKLEKLLFSQFYIMTRCRRWPTCCHKLNISTFFFIQNSTSCLVWTDLNFHYLQNLQYIHCEKTNPCRFDMADDYFPHKLYLYITANI